MAAIKYLDLTGLQIYDAQIKTKISEGDAKAIKNFVYDEATRTLKFYKAETVAEGAVADFTMTLPSDVDTSGLLEKLTGATEGNVVVANADGTVKDGGVALADLATKEEVGVVDDKADANAEAIEAINDETTGILAQAKAHADGKDEAIAEAKKAGDDAQADVDALTEVIGEVPADKTVVQMIADAQTDATYDDTEVKADIKANTDAIAKLNDGAEVEGSIDYKIAQAVAAIMENPDETMNSINELVTWINGHAQDALELSNKVTANEEAIADLEALVGEEGVAQQITDAIAEALTVEGVDKYALATDLTAAIARVATLEGKAHEHENKAVLDAITAEKVSAWDASEQNAKDYADGLAVNYDAAGSATAAQTNAQTYADGLNTAMDTRVDALETLVGEGTEAIPTDDILAMFA